MVLVHEVAAAGHQRHRAPALDPVLVEQPLDVVGVVERRLAGDLDPVVAAAAEPGDRRLDRLGPHPVVHRHLERHRRPLLSVPTSPSLPGFITSLGSSAALIAPDRVERRAVLAAHVGAELDADAVVVVDDRAGIERRGHAVLPDPVVQRERVGPAVGHHEAAVDHRAPRVPVREVHPQLEPDVAVRLADRARAARRRPPRCGRTSRRRRACPRSRAARAGGAGGRSRSGGPTSAARAPGRAPRRPPRRAISSVRRSSSAAASASPSKAEHRVDAATGPRRRPGANASRVASSSYMRTTDGRWPTLQRAPDRADAGAHGRERDRGEAALVGQRHELQRRPRDHAERALRADEQLRELRPDRVARDARRLHQPARRRRHAQRQHEVLDLAVAGREHARAARRDVAADRRPLDRRGVVRQHQPAGVELGLELAAVLAGLDGDGHRDLVDLDHLVERAEVDHDAAVDGKRAALRARAAAPRHHRDAVLVRDREHGRRRPPRCVAVRPRPGAPSASQRPLRAAPASTCRPCRRPSSAGAVITAPSPSAEESAASASASAPCGDGGHRPPSRTFHNLTNNSASAFNSCQGHVRDGAFRSGGRAADVAGAPSACRRSRDGRVAGGGRWTPKRIALVVVAAVVVRLDRDQGGRRLHASSSPSRSTA